MSGRHPPTQVAFSFAFTATRSTFPFPSFFFMITKSLISSTFVLLAATLLSTATSRGDIAITAREVGKDVVFSYTGSIDVTGLGATTAASVRGIVYPVNAYVEFGGSSMINNAATGYFSAVANPAMDVPDNIGTGGATIVTRFSGSYFSVTRSGIKVPNGYVSGGTISGSMTFAGTKLASMGVNTNNAPYEWILSNGQKVTLTFLTPIAASAQDLKKELKQLKKKLRAAKQTGKASLVRKFLKQIKSVKADLKAI